MGLSRTVSEIISNFSRKSQNSERNPVSAGAKYVGGVKILQFSIEITVYLENGTS